MSFKDVSEINGDYDLRQRVIACAALQRISDSPEQWVSDLPWGFATQPNWESSWHNAKAAGKEGLGADESVITDEMILAAVASLV